MFERFPKSFEHGKEGEESANLGKPSEAAWLNHHLTTTKSIIKSMWFILQRPCALHGGTIHCDSVLIKSKSITTTRETYLIRPQPISKLNWIELNESVLLHGVLVLYIVSIYFTTATEVSVAINYEIWFIRIVVLRIEPPSATRFFISKTELKRRKKEDETKTKTKERRKEKKKRNQSNQGKLNRIRCTGVIT